MCCTNYEPSPRNPKAKSANCDKRVFSDLTDFFLCKIKWINVGCNIMPDTATSALLCYFFMDDFGIFVHFFCVWMVFRIFDHYLVCVCFFFALFMKWYFFYFVYERISQIKNLITWNITLFFVRMILNFYCWRIKEIKIVYIYVYIWVCVWISYNS